MKVAFHRTICLLSSGLFGFGAAGAVVGAESPQEATEETADVDSEEGDRAFLDAPVSTPRDDRRRATDSAAGGDKSTGARDHFLQGGANVLLGTGWFVVAPYDKNDEDKRCGPLDIAENAPSGPAICSGRSAWHLDFLAGIGLLPGFELFAMFRLGLARPDAYTSVQRQIGVGVKAYSPAAGLFKIGFGVAPLFDFSKRRANLGKDLVIHVPVLAHFDVSKWMGAYLQVAPNISFVTEFKLDITLGLGIQGRYP